MPIGFIWQTFLETPLINLMVLLSVVSFGSFGIAILLFTLLSRALLFPLTLRTLNSTRRLQEIQPEIERIKKQYSDPRRQSEETLKLYRESGVNPLGCLGPQLLQMPLFIALYQVIRITLGNTPESVGNLSGRLYNVDIIQNAVPLSTEFLFLDLSANGNIYLTIVVFCSMWLQQRISTARNTSTSSSSQQAQMNQMMQWMMPAIFAWFVLAVPAGLGLYWGASTVVGIFLQWVFVGPGDFEWASLIPNIVRAQVGMKPYVPPSERRPAPRGAAAAVAGDDDQPASEEDGTNSGDTDEGGRNQRSNRRRGRRSGSGSTGSRSRSGRRRRRQRR
jgi:YidC/Oxa1 family membrane protein insertase